MARIFRARRSDPTVVVTKIIDGPDKASLFCALSERRPNPQKIIFTSGNGEKTSVTIISIKAEDDSGDSWSITGYATEGMNFKAYYRTDTKKGTFSKPN